MHTNVIFMDSVPNGRQFTAYLHPPGGNFDDLIFTSLLELQNNSDTIKCHASRVRRTAAFFKRGKMRKLH